MSEDSSLTRDSIFEEFIKSFRQYYDIKKEGVAEPFDAEAEFHSHSEQYLLVKSARISEVNTSEFVFFVKTDELTQEKLEVYCSKSWEEGMSRVRPSFTHKNSDVVLVVVADKISDQAKKSITKIKNYKSYCLSLKGYSHFKLVSMEISSGELYANRLGSDLKKIFTKIISKVSVGGEK